MIFEEIVLHNFGIYKDRHVVKLAPPSPRKAIILLGGLNGSGKTTLLDALQLTLYGKFAKYSNRGSGNYFDYLRRMINYHVEADIGTTLELQFKHFREGEEESIRVHRSWRLSGKSVKETVEVERNGLFDPVITDRWYEYVEEFIPAKISGLFFFDGEKIEAFADQNKAAALLRTGIHALLGMDLVERLSTDLLMVERKRKAQLQSQQSRANIIAKEKKVEQLEQQAKKIAKQKAEARQQLAQSKQEQDNLREEYRREGGELFDQRTTIEAQLETAKQSLVQIEEPLHEIAAGEAPLLLVRDLLNNTESQVVREQEAKYNRAIYQEFNERDASLLKLLKRHEANRASLTAIEEFMEEDQSKRQQSLVTECYLNLETKAFTRLHDSFLDQVVVKIGEFIGQAEEFTEKINSCERKLASIPDPESLEGITSRLQANEKVIKQAEIRVETLVQEHKRISNELERKEIERDLAYEIEAQEKFADETTNRILNNAKKVRHTVEKFDSAMMAKYIRLLESLILDSFQQLIRKNNFISKIEIEPNSYTLILYTPTNQKLPPENLSAGERQLLAVSILWGLSRASGRPLPAIIDTPLSRLDGKHRNNLVDNYFHQASHQVILLSTDEEINEKYHRNLKPAIGREYHITYDEGKQSSVIKPGYFF